MNKLNIKILIFNKKWTSNIKKCCTFATTVPVLLPVRLAHGSFSKDSLITQDNTPPMPLYDAHLGGFLIL